MTTPRHIIFGTGSIGLATFEALRRRGETVRLVNRSGHWCPTGQHWERLHVWPSCRAPAHGRSHVRRQCFLLSTPAVNRGSACHLRDVASARPRRLDP